MEKQNTHHTNSLKNKQNCQLPSRPSYKLADSNPPQSKRNAGPKIINDIHKNIHQQILVSFKGVSRCVQELLSLSLRATLQEDHTCIRAELKQLLINFFGVRSAHHIDIEGELQHSQFWKPVQQSPLNIADANLIFSRSSGSRRIQKISEDKGEIIKKLGLKSKFIYKFSKKYEFLFLQFAENSWVVEQPDAERENGTLAIIFRVYCENSKLELAQALLDLVHQYVSCFKAIAHKIIKNATKIPFKMSALGIDFEDDPIFSLVISNLFHMANRESTFMSNCFNIMRVARTPFKYMLYMRGELVYANCTSEEMAQQQLQHIRTRKIAPKQLLEAVGVSMEVSKEILQKLDVDGTHSGIASRWSLRNDRDLGLVQIMVSTADTCRRVGGVHTFQSKIMLGFIKHMKNNVIQNTIGNQFMPNEQKEQTSSKSHYGEHLKRLMTVENRKPSQKFKLKILNVELNLECPQRKLIDDLEYNILHNDLGVVCNMIHQIMVTRFPVDDFDDQKLYKFIQKVGYYYQKNSNPFHNMYHCFTVLHGAYIISRSDVFTKVFDQDCTLTFLVSAICHDLSHTGVNNAFEQKTQSRLANRYGDKSILQNYSISKALKLFSNDQTNFICKVSDKSWKQMRRLLVSTILATDNKNHTIVLSDFEPYIYEQKGLLTSRESIEKVMGALLHGCDFWGNVKQFKVSRAWAVRVNEEFSKQYDREVSLDLEITPYFKNLDDVLTMAKNQHFFISAIVYPLYKKINDWCDGYLKVPVNRVEKNLEIWKTIGQTGLLEGFI